MINLFQMLEFFRKSSIFSPQIKRNSLCFWWYFPVLFTSWSARYWYNQMHWQKSVLIFSLISSVKCNYCFSSESRSDFSNWSVLKLSLSCSLKMEIHLNPIYILLNFKIIALYLRKLISYSPSDPESQSF